MQIDFSHSLEAEAESCFAGEELGYVDKFC